jgi:hypothetical protein
MAVNIHNRYMILGSFNTEVTIAPQVLGSARRSLDGLPCCRYWDNDALLFATVRR